MNIRRFCNRIWTGLTAVPAGVWTAIVLALVTIVLIRAHTELDHTVRVLRTARLRWLLVLTALAAAVQLLIAAKVRQILRLLGHRVPLLPLTDALLRRNVISTVVPVGVAPGSVVFARRMRDYAVPPEHVALTFLIYSTLGHASFALVMLPVLIWVAATSSVPAAVVIAAVALALIALGLMTLLGLILARQAVPAALTRRLPGPISTALANTLAVKLPVRRLLLPLLNALLVDLVGIAMVRTALAAIASEGGWRAAAGGYVVGTIFLLIAPVLGGLGLVEVTMAVALERLGVRTAAALGATLLYRVGDTWSPLALGVALQIRAQEAVRRLPRNLPAIATGLTGLLSVLSVLAPTIPRRFNRLEDYAFLSFNDVSRTFSLVAGSLLIGLSLALARRRYVAWCSAVAMLTILILTHIFKRHDQIVAIVGGINLLLLLVTRNRFRVRSDVPTLRRGIALFVGCLLFAVAYGTLGFWLLDRREFGLDFSAARSMRETTRLFFDLGETDLHPRTRYAQWFLDSVSLVGLIAIAGAAISLLRPVVWRARTLPQERFAARRIIAASGRSALDEFKSWPDKVFFFAPDRRAVVSFGVSNGVAVVLGDPTAPDEAAFHAILTDFLDFCDANAWQVAFHQVGPEHLADYAAAGLATLKLGEEAVVDLTNWSLAGNTMKGFRSAVNRLEREGYRAVLHEPPIADAVLAGLHDVSDAWLALPGRRERAFTLGQWEPDYVRRCPVFTLESSTGEIVAFINIVADGAPGEGTFDLMRHRSDAPNGAMDVLFVHLAEHFRAHGKTAFSLGMVPFYEVGSAPDDPLLERVIRRLIDRMERFFSYRGLSAYKDKFHPRWEARYLIYPNAVVLPQVALAIVRLTEGQE